MNRTKWLVDRNISNTMNGNGIIHLLYFPYEVMYVPWTRIKTTLVPCLLNWWIQGRFPVDTHSTYGSSQTHVHLISCVIELALCTSMYEDPHNNFSNHDSLSPIRPHPLFTYYERTYAPNSSLNGKRSRPFFFDEWWRSWTNAASSVKGWTRCNASIWHFGCFLHLLIFHTICAQ